MGITALSSALQGAFIPILGILATLLPLEFEQSIATIINVSLLLIFALGSFYSWVLLGKKIEQLREASSSEDEISEEEMMKMIKEGTK